MLGKQRTAWRLAVNMQSTRVVSDRVNWERGILDQNPKPADCIQRSPDPPTEADGVGGYQLLLDTSLPFCYKWRIMSVTRETHRSVSEVVNRLVYGWSKAVLLRLDGRTVLSTGDMPDEINEEWEWLVRNHPRAASYVARKEQRTRERYRNILEVDQKSL